MKRILLSVSLMGFALAGVYAVNATGAFFSDTETSTGNTFTAGALDLKVDSTAHYAGLVCTNTGSQEVPVYTWVDDNPTSTTRPDLIGQPCSGTWTLADLGPALHFFNLTDLKPGDPGENTVSLHVDNDAWACLDIGTNANNENTALEPELTDGDTAANGPADGELAQNTQIMAWLDQGTTPGFGQEGDTGQGDNIRQAETEPLLFGPVALSTLNSTTTLALADATHLPAMAGGVTSYVGIAWCVGTLNATTGACDGSSVGNVVQTDSATSTVQFRAVQSRNNPNFSCNPS